MAANETGLGKAGWSTQLGTNGTGVRWWQCQSPACGALFQSDQEIIWCIECEEEEAYLAPQHRASHYARIV